MPEPATEPPFDSVAAGQRTWDDGWRQAHLTPPATEPPFTGAAVVEIIRTGTGCSERDAVLTARVLDQAKWLRKEAERG